MIQNIMYRLFGTTVPKLGNQDVKTSFRSLYPEETLSFEQWCRALNVSAYYDRSRKF